jgi:hypothetical protein
MQNLHVTQWLERQRGQWLTRPKLNFFFAGFFISQAVILLFLTVAHTGRMDSLDMVRGRDFLQFYISGQIAAHGEIERLYDQDYFFNIQQSLVPIIPWKSPRYVSVYPPLVSMIFSFLGRLPYETAIAVWWSIQIVLFACAGKILWNILSPLPEWRVTAGLGFTAFYPVINTIANGQITALLFLLLVIGMELLRNKRPFLAGCVLSLIAMKPQLIVGILAWLLLRKDIRTLTGLCFGGFLQIGAVSLVLSPQTILDYVTTLQSYSTMFRIHSVTPNHEHGVGGILRLILGMQYSNLALLFQIPVVIYAGILLRRVMGFGPFDDRRQELSAAIIFSLLATPHLLTYDLVYLLIPVTYMLSSRNPLRDTQVQNSVTILYLPSTLAPLFVLISLIPVALLWSLHLIAHHSWTPIPLSNSTHPLAGED